MKNLFLIFNHQFTPAQEDDARSSLNVEYIKTMPEDVRAVWGNVPTEPDAIGLYLQPVKNWLLDHAGPGDFVLIQGDFGACYLMVNFCFENNMIPVYATTRREAVEEHQPDGTVKMTHHFKHQGFRRYGQ